MQTILDPRLHLRDVAVTGGGRGRRGAPAIRPEMTERVVESRQGGRSGTYCRGGDRAAQKKFRDHRSACAL
jgi:hypothetical protein